MKFLHGKHAGIGLFGVFLFTRSERVIAQRCAWVEPQLGVESAECAECLFGFPDQATGGVGDGHQIRLALGGRVRAVFHIADNAAQFDGFAGLIRGTVGVQIPFRREAGAELQALQTHGIGRHVTVDNRERAEIDICLELIVLAAKHAILLGGARAKHFFTIAEQHLHAGRRFAGAPVLDKHQRFAARAFQNQIQITADHERGGLEIVVTHIDEAHAGLRLVERHFNGLFVRAVISVVVDLHFPGFVRLNERDIEVIDVADRVRLTEVRLEVEEVLFHRHLLNVPRGELHGGFFVGAIFALSLQHQRRLGH